MRTGIRYKRGRTWHWQDAVYIKREATNYAERSTHGCGYLKWINRKWNGLADRSWKLYSKLQEPEAAICFVFGQYCSQALSVARCESGQSISRHAVNGQYLGIFQMGSSERRIYGHGDTFLDQAIAAHKYFVASGRDWSPWSCKPY